jgi:hypothetical protein
VGIITLNNVPRLPCGFWWIVLRANHDSALGMKQVVVLVDSIALGIHVAGGRT